MEETHLLEQIFQQYGLLGLIISFLIVGPGFTYLKAKSAQLRAEVKARELINDFVQHELERADQLEKQIQETLIKLERAENDVELLSKQLKDAQKELLEVEQLKEIIRVLTQRINELEALVGTQ